MATTVLPGQIGNSKATVSTIKNSTNGKFACLIRIPAFLKWFGEIYSA
jgi:hypothetical protein